MPQTSIPSVTLAFQNSQTIMIKKGELFSTFFDMSFSGTAHLDTRNDVVRILQATAFGRGTDALVEVEKARHGGLGGLNWLK